MIKRALDFIKPYLSSDDDDIRVAAESVLEGLVRYRRKAMI